MKLTSVLAVAFTVVASVSASPSRETNGERLARGLTPLAPQKRSGTPSYGAKRSGPSGSPISCTIQCCKFTGTKLDPAIAFILELLGIVIKAVDDNVLIGVDCTDNSDSCSAQLVCCTDNSYGGRMSMGCSLHPTLRCSWVANA
ncbi:hypothetical protein BT96DRAFT_939936 [Gymnopus androsaceus JB14]|uniref:Hydrophobin n=1 Tax=Gymnopus androsaceus JB14 TaxID=1447944 RepID=A0A6A4HP35_9AGAR|nr:hypothetical protein BT96DRAFT_939936 [Gymnopus androsaceus JB14]